MHFFSWANADSFIKDFAAKLDEGTAECICDGSEHPAPWRSVEKAGVDGWWTRFCITEEPVGTITHYIVSLVTWPDGALKDPSIKPTSRKICAVRWRRWGCGPLSPLCSWTTVAQIHTSSSSGAAP